MNVKKNPFFSTKQTADIWLSLFISLLILWLSISRYSAVNFRKYTKERKWEPKPLSYPFFLNLFIF